MRNFPKHLTTTALLGLSTLGAAALTSCRQHTVEVNGQNINNAVAQKVQAATTTPSGTPILLPNVLTSVRSQYQTRSVIVLNINSSDIAAGDDLQLFNDSTNASLLSSAVPNLGLTEEQSTFHLANREDQPFTLTLTIFPLDPEFTGKFSYGTNNLRLQINGANSTAKMSDDSIALHDFTYFHMGIASFESGGQRQDGFQGAFGFLTGPTQTNGFTTLDNGLIGIIND